MLLMERTFESPSCQVHIVVRLKVRSGAAGAVVVVVGVSLRPCPSRPDVVIVVGVSLRPCPSGAGRVL